jgi:hypothetical protein
MSALCVVPDCFVSHRFVHDSAVTFRARPKERFREVGGGIPDGIARSETNPLGNGAVLLLRLRKLLLGTERLLALCRVLIFDCLF